MGFVPLIKPSTVPLLVSGDEVGIPKVEELPLLPEPTDFEIPTVTVPSIPRDTVPPFTPDL